MENRIEEVDYAPAQRNIAVVRVALLASGGTLLGIALWRRSWYSIPLAIFGGALVFGGIKNRPAVNLAAELERAVESNGEGFNGVRVERSIIVRAPIQEVYQFWRTLENLPTFMSHLESVQALEDGHYHWTARAPLGTNAEWDAELAVDRPNEMLAWRSLPESQIYNQGTVLFRRGPGGQGTEVIVTLEYDPPGGTTGAFIARMIGEEPVNQIREDLRRFKQLMEAGETTDEA